MESSISWEAYEYVHEPKSTDWFWALWIISIALAGAAIIFQSYLFAILILVATTSLHIHAYHIPRIVPFHLNEKGIKVDNTFYSYKTLESFSIETHETEVGLFSRLFIKSRKTFMPLIVVPIAEVHPEEVQEYLSIFLEEGEHRESAGEKLLEWLGF